MSGTARYDWDAMRFYEAVQDVYFDDLDAFKILHNARYLLLFERTLGAFWRRLGYGDALDMAERPDMFHMVRANNIEYLKPVLGVGQVRVRAWVEKLGTTSCTFGLRMLPLDEDVDHARGTRTIVKVDPQHQRPDAWSDTFREQLAPYRRDLDKNLGGE